MPQIETDDNGQQLLAWSVTLPDVPPQHARVYLPSEAREVMVVAALDGTVRAYVELMAYAEK